MLFNSDRECYAKISNIRKRQIYKIATGAISESEEEILLRHILLEHCGLQEFSYLDVGCSDPVTHSITHNFYKSGMYGVCVDANPVFGSRFKEIRPNDVFINAGITDCEDGEEKDFYVLSNKMSSTFDENWAKNVSKQHNLQIEKTLKVKLRNINYIIEENFKSAPDLLLLDLEGMDFQVIQSLDFKKYRPKVIMMEVWNMPYDADKVFDNFNKTKNFLGTKGYIWICTNTENCIFIDREQFIINIRDKKTLIESHSPKVSLILTVYNQGDRVLYDVYSILDQAVVDVELIIVDDGSTDDTLNLLEEYAKEDKRIKIIIQKHQGLAIARNNGVTAATSKYITFIGGDNVCSASKLKFQLDFLENNKHYSACYLTSSKKNGSQPTGTEYNAHISHERGIFNHHKWQKLDIRGAYSLITKESFLEFGGYRHNAAIIGEVDFAMRYRSSEYNVIGLFCENMYCHEYSKTPVDMMQQDILNSVKRLASSLVCEWCRHKWLADPVDQGKDLDEILAMKNLIPWKDGSIIYSYLYPYRNLIVAGSNLNRQESKVFILRLVSDDFMKRWLIDLWFKWKIKGSVSYKNIKDVF